MKVKDLIGYNDCKCVFTIFSGLFLEVFDPSCDNFEEFLLEDIADEEVCSYQVVNKNEIVIHL